MLANGTAGSAHRLALSDAQWALLVRASELRPPGFESEDLSEP
ncbi:hypothetical protein GCM10022225_51180 [Plantactinospora mayteni]|uniref:Transposase n=1 Tax=Plantactinospora mayteni TaxID=566021 RepID=A0ABQ4F481_9ACTN|nr:hypothetical protein [Plantactinospora mayteni]GIH01703.1 hypothetical protein Pma05_82750 [Plantactinospora mayteni]